MGSLKDAIKKLDPAPEKKTQITLLLTLLSELCEQKAAQFTESVETELRTAGFVENKTIPVTEIVARHKEYRAYVKDDAGKIASEVATGIKSFISGSSGQVLDGISNLVTTGIQAIIGAGSGTQQEMSSYYIIVQGFAILRFDVRIWCRQIEAEGITKQIETAFAIVTYKSSVDVRKITLNTFLLAYQEQLGKIGIAEKEWEHYLQTAENLFEKLRRLPPSNSAALPEAEFAANSIRLREPGELRGTLWDD